MRAIVAVICDIAPSLLIKFSEDVFISKLLANIFSGNFTLRAIYVDSARAESFCLCAGGGVMVWLFLSIEGLGRRCKAQ